MAYTPCTTPSLSRLLRQPARLGLVFGFALLLAGCSGSLNGLLRRAELRSVAVGVEPSGQVAVLLQAEASGQPLTQLSAANFRILENSKPVDPALSKLTLHPLAAVADFHVLLMVDLSGIATQPDLRSQLSQAVAGFVSVIRRTQAITLYAFDGSDQPSLLAEFPKGTEAAPIGRVEAIEAYVPKDASRNLRGALVQGLTELNVRVMQSSKPIRMGTLVIFSQGGDLAQRVSGDTYHGSIDATQRRIVLIHMDAPTPELKRLGKDAIISAGNGSGLGPAWQTAASRVDALMAENYVLSYCSPARGGKRLVRVEAQALDANGQQRTGRLNLKIDSAGFSGTCDATRPPTFEASTITSAPPAIGSPNTGASPGNPAAGVPAAPPASPMAPPGAAPVPAAPAPAAPAPTAPTGPGAAVAPTPSAPNARTVAPGTAQPPAAIGW